MDKIDQMAMEAGCRHEKSRIVSVICDDQVTVINRCLELMGRELPKPLILGNHNYLGRARVAHNCCPNCIPYGYDYFCQNPVRIQQFLDTQPSQNAIIG